jgi:hypothetical protein
MTLTAPLVGDSVSPAFSVSGTLTNDIATLSLPPALGRLPMVP